jgi:hypothetical protein
MAAARRNGKTGNEGKDRTMDGLLREMARIKGRDDESLVRGVLKQIDQPVRRGFSLTFAWSAGVAALLLLCGGLILFHVLPDAPEPATAGTGDIDKPEKEVPEPVVVPLPAPKPEKAEKPIAPSPVEKEKQPAEDPEAVGTADLDKPEKVEKPVAPSPVEKEKHPTEGPEAPVNEPGPKPVIVREGPKLEPKSPETVVRKTVTGAASLERVRGKVEILSQQKKSLASTGQWIDAGDHVMVGAGANASLLFLDGTQVELEESSTALLPREVVEAPEEGRLYLSKGRLTARIPRSKKARQVRIEAPQGIVTVVEADFRLALSSRQMHLDVMEGSIRFARPDAPESFFVPSGWSAVVTPKTFELLEQDDARDDIKFQFRVDDAIAKGVKFLRGAGSPPATTKAKIANSDELILLALLSADIDDNDPYFRKLLGRMLPAPLEKTYAVSLHAMVLEELDRVKYQPRIHQCAQYLADNQCKNGQWPYGTPTKYVDTPPPVKATGTSGSRQYSSKKTDDKPKVIRRIPVRKRKGGEASGDNSNSQYAALGLRACHDSGILFEVSVIKRAADWWRTSLNKAVAKEGAYGGRGWGYGASYAHIKTTFGAMTAGGAGALVIYNYMMKSSWQRDPAVRQSIQWMASHFKVDSHPGYHGKGDIFTLYYLYAIERFGMLSGTEKIGRHLWYREGAEHILKIQQKDGAWCVWDRKPVWDTCFAILFLKRATRPVATKSGWSR